MLEPEGVIKYQLSHHGAELPPTIDIASLDGWRWLLFQLHLIGQDPQRYDGLGYGNISQRLEPQSYRFAISGTQTGHLEHLDRRHVAIVDRAEPLANRLYSSGPVQPSSEALTHASVYQHQADTNAVIHVHCPLLWRHTDTLALPHTAANIGYGTVAMALAVEKLLNDPHLQSLGTFSMLGHRDGIVSFGSDLSQAVQRLLRQLSRAVAIEQQGAAR